MKHNKFKVSTIFKALICVLAIALLVASSTIFSIAQVGTGRSNAQAETNYDDLVVQGRVLLKGGNFLEANAVAIRAIQINPDRFEAYLIAATARAKGGQKEQVKTYMDMALARVPANKKEQLQQVASQLEAMQESPLADGELQRKLDVLNLIIADADNAPNQFQRDNHLQEYLERSGELLKMNPDITSIWVIRAAIGLELNDAHIGWEAGHKLITLKADSLGDAKINDLMAKLDRRGWLADQDPAEVAREQAEKQRAIFEQEQKQWEFAKEANDAQLKKMQEAKEQMINVAVSNAVRKVLGKWEYVMLDNKIDGHGKGSIELRMDENNQLTCTGSYHFRCGNWPAIFDKGSGTIVSIEKPQFGYLPDGSDGDRFIYATVHGNFTGSANNLPADHVELIFPSNPPLKVNGSLITDYLKLGSEFFIRDE